MLANQRVEGLSTIAQVSGTGALVLPDRGDESLRSDMNPGKGMKKSKDIHEPQNHGNNNDAVQN